MHFLQTLERKPAYLEKTRLFNELKLPEAFAQLAPSNWKGNGESVKANGSTSRRCNCWEPTARSG